MEQSVRRQFFFSFRIERVRRRARYRCDELVETNRSIARSFGLLRVHATTEPSKMVLPHSLGIFFSQFSIQNRRNPPWFWLLEIHSILVTGVGEESRRWQKKFKKRKKQEKFQKINEISSLARNFCLFALKMSGFVWMKGFCACYLRMFRRFPTEEEKSDWGFFCRIWSGSSSSTRWYQYLSHPRNIPIFEIFGFLKNDDYPIHALAGILVKNHEHTIMCSSLPNIERCLNIAQNFQKREFTLSLSKSVMSWSMARIAILEKCSQLLKPQAHALFVEKHNVFEPAENCNSWTLLKTFGIASTCNLCHVISALPLIASVL